MVIKKDSKISLTVKNSFVEDGHLIDVETGECLEMAEIIEKVFGDNEVKIQVTSSSSEDIDPPTSSDEE